MFYRVVNVIQLTSKHPATSSNSSDEPSRPRTIYTRSSADSCLQTRGTRSTLTPHDGQFTRRIVYTSTTGIIHNGTKSKRRGVG